jgi:hypothetical protein
MRREIGPGRSRSEPATSLIGGKTLISFPYQIDGSMQRVAVNHDLDGVSIQDAANGPTRQRLRRDVADACTG